MACEMDGQFHVINFIYLPNSFILVPLNNITQGKKIFACKYLIFGLSMCTELINN